jgi:RNA polymerase sigma factor for flagellar operon FliA
MEPLSDVERDRITSHTALVSELARSVTSRHRSSFSIEELRSAGYEGLVAAARSFDPVHGLPFRAFAYFRVQGAMIDAIRREARASRARLLAAASALQRHLQTEPDDTNPLDEDDDAARERLQRMAEQSMACLVEASIAEASRRAGRPTEQAAERDADEARVAALSAARAELSARDRRILELLFDEERQLPEAARELSVSASTLRRHLPGVYSRLASRLRGRGVVSA